MPKLYFQLARQSYERIPNENGIRDDVFEVARAFLASIRTAYVTRGAEGIEERPIVCVPRLKGKKSMHNFLRGESLLEYTVSPEKQGPQNELGNIIVLWNRATLDTHLEDEYRRTASPLIRTEGSWGGRFEAGRTFPSAMRYKGDIYITCEISASSKANAEHLAAIRDHDGYRIRNYKTGPKKKPRPSRAKEVCNEEDVDFNPPRSRKSAAERADEAAMRAEKGF